MLPVHPSSEYLADADELSVDALYGFGAKNLDRCAEITQRGNRLIWNYSLVISHFDDFLVIFGSVMVRRERKRPISGRLCGVKPGAFRGMLPSCRLVRRRLARRAKLKNDKCGSARGVRFRSTTSTRHATDWRFPALPVAVIQ